MNIKQIKYDAGWDEETQTYSLKLMKERLLEEVGRHFISQNYKERWSSNYRELIKLR